MTSLLYSVFFDNIIFTTLLSLAKSLGTDVNLSISNLSTSVLRLARFGFDAKLLTSTCVEIYNF